MNHSPEPWSVDQVCVVDENNRVIVKSDWVRAIDAKDDLDRIVACVNACVGIPAGDLRRGILSDMKVAILSKDPNVLQIVSERLHQILSGP